MFSGVGGIGEVRAHSAKVEFDAQTGVRLSVQRKTMEMSRSRIDVEAGGDRFAALDRPRKIVTMTREGAAQIDS